ncbi:apoptosis regulator BAX-like [Hydra vulgaris]|uniref:apoptosis regulator BAX-like n=1 Tax=Hydra vulgaris TaxID=6087 RepID=UPI000640C070|nr:apoptosis regulator BAX [Hydra vulgaris]
MGPPAQPKPTIENNQPLNEEAPSLDTVDGRPQRFNNGGTRLRNQPRNVVVNVNNSSNQVIESTPELFTQFLVNRMENDNIEVPEELRNRSRNGTVNKEVAHCLKRIGDDLVNNHQLNHLISSIQVTRETAYKTFFDVASHVFADGTINWGRVVTLFYFAYKLAIQVVNQLPLVEIVIGWVQKFVTDRLAQWIAERGGWNAVQEYFGSTTVQFVGVFAAGFLFAYILTKVFRR